MSDINRVVLVGRAVADVECRYTTGGTAVADLRLAVNRQKDKDNEETSFLDVTLWGRQAEVAGEYITKGKRIAVDGRLQQQAWEKDGSKHSKVVVVAESFQFLDSAKKADATPVAVKADNTGDKSPSNEEKVPF